MTTLQIEVEDTRPVEVHCDEKSLAVTLADGRVLQTPLWWYPRLYNAPASALRVVELMPMGMHWPEIDEDISVASMLSMRSRSGFGSHRWSRTSYHFRSTRSACDSGLPPRPASWCSQAKLWPL